MSIMGIYALRRRNVPGAVPFAVLAAGSILWLIGSTLRQISTVDAVSIFWFKVEAFLLPVAISAALCFAIEYAGLGRWLTRRTIVLLAVVVLIYLLLILTNGIHHLVWKALWVEGHVHARFGLVNWFVVAYGYFLSLLHMVLLAGLFIRSPRHRWIAVWLMLTLLITRAGYTVRLSDWDLFQSIDPLVIAINFALLPYALAVFRFHMFDVVAVARDIVLERMPEGMMVLDAGDRVVDLNETAQTLLGVSRSKAVSGPVAGVLHAYPGLLGFIRGPGAVPAEVPFGKTNVTSGDNNEPPGNSHTRWVQVSLSPLIDRRGFNLGRLVWFHDITELKQTQRQLLHRERTLAMLEERELLARELHDGIGQMVAAAHLQVKSASEFLARGEKTSAESCLGRVAEVTQEAKESIRAYLLGVKDGSPEKQDFIPRVREYLDHYERNHGIRVELIVPPELEAERIDSSLGSQLQPIIQEALVNTRKYGQAGSVRVIFASCGGQLKLIIEEVDGRGFNPADIGDKSGFGLRSMQGRAEAMGGHFELSSTPGKGTRVIVRVPWRKEEI